MSNRVLNPLFVGNLMGLPFGWTDSGAQVTGLSQWLQLSRSYIYAIAYPDRSEAVA